MEETTFTLSEVQAIIGNTKKVWEEEFKDPQYKNYFKAALLQIEIELLRKKNEPKTKGFL